MLEKMKFNLNKIKDKEDRKIKKYMLKKYIQKLILLGNIKQRIYYKDQ
jgi:DUF1009 family protein